MNNAFQQPAPQDNAGHKVLEEFDGMVATLRSAGIEVIVIDDTADPPKPDAIFPNNWFCTLADGSLAVFPMFAPNRREERRKDIIDLLMHEYKVTELEDWTSHEAHEVFLEGTGSMVMDHDNRIIYACISQRTNPMLLYKFGERTGYEVVSFSANDKKGVPVYHTNVMMCIGNGFCLACDEVIRPADRELFFSSLTRSGLAFISISYEQMLQFAGNMLQLKNNKGEFQLVMSLSAYNSLHPGQKKKLEKYTQLLPVNIPTIEATGGGSARCMMAEIFLNGNWSY